MGTKKRMWPEQTARRIVCKCGATEGLIVRDSPGGQERRFGNSSKNAAVLTCIACGRRWSSKASGAWAIKSRATWLAERATSHGEKS